MTFTRVSSGDTISSSEMQSNFEHVGAGDMLPKSGDTAMSAVNGVFNVGSPEYKWNDVYPGVLSIDKQFNSNTSRTVTGERFYVWWPIVQTFTMLEQKAQYTGLRGTWNKIGEITTVGTTKNTVGFTGLNGDSDIVYKLTAMVVTDTAASYALRFNDIRQTGTSSNMAIVAEDDQEKMTSGVGNFIKKNDMIHWLNTPANTLTTGWCEMLIYARTGSNRMIIGNSIEGIQGAATSTNIPASLKNFGCIWHNAEDTVTSIYITNQDTTTPFLADCKFQLWARL